MVIKVKDSESDTCFSQIPSDSQFNHSKSVIGESVGSGDDGQYIDSRRKCTNNVDLCLRENWATKKRVSGDRGFEDNGLGIGLGDTASACARKQGCWWTDGGRGNNGIRIQEINASDEEKNDRECMGRDTIETPVRMNWLHTGGRDDRLSEPCTPMDE